MAWRGVSSWSSTCIIQVIQHDDEMEIKAYYAGHVLGAAMFHIRVGSQSIVYTGDYNMTPDRHLGAAWYLRPRSQRVHPTRIPLLCSRIDKCRPDLLITESTYATTIRDSKRCRERDFLKKVHDCVEKGGKVLIPVFALGRAQVRKMKLLQIGPKSNLGVFLSLNPTGALHLIGDILGAHEFESSNLLQVSFGYNNSLRTFSHSRCCDSTGLTEKANNYYKMFITWTNEKIRKTFVERNMFEFKHIRSFDRSYMQVSSGVTVDEGVRSQLGSSFRIQVPWWSSPLLECCTVVFP